MHHILLNAKNNFRNFHSNREVSAKFLSHINQTSLVSPLFLGSITTDISPLTAGQWEAFLIINIISSRKAANVLISFSRRLARALERTKLSLSPAPRRASSRSLRAIGFSAKKVERSKVLPINNVQKTNNFSVHLQIEEKYSTVCAASKYAVARS
jgi:hypothetical protein